MESVIIRFLLYRVTRWTNQKLDQSNLFTTVSTQSDSVSELTFAHHSPYQFLRLAYLRVNKVDVLQHGSWVSPVVNLIYCHVQLFSNNSGEPYGDNTGCQFQSWNWNFIYETSSCFSREKFAEQFALSFWPPTRPSTVFLKLYLTATVLSYPIFYQP